MNPKLLRDARKKAGISQDELAKKLGVKQATISKYETGIVSPTMEMLDRIANELGFADPRELIADPNDPDYSAVIINDFCASRIEFKYKLDAIGWSERLHPEGIDTYELTNGDISIIATADEIKQLDRETDNYLRFKLEELRLKK